MYHYLQPVKIQKCVNMKKKVSDDKGGKEPWRPGSAALITFSSFQ